MIKGPTSSTPELDPDKMQNMFRSTFSQNSTMSALEKNNTQQIDDHETYLQEDSGVTLTLRQPLISK